MRSPFNRNDYGAASIIFAYVHSLTVVTSIALDDGATVLCCNGGKPRALSRDAQLSRRLSFQPVNATESKNDCILYRAQLGAKLLIVASKDDTVLGCHCDSRYSGDHCERIGESLDESRPEAAAISSSDNSSFRIFLFIAVIPLSFALLAGIGAFLCRMCFCDCFAMHDYCKRCWSKDPYNLETDLDLAAEALMDRQTAAYRRDRVGDNREAVRHDTNSVIIGARELFDPPPPFEAIEQSSENRPGLALPQRLGPVITNQPNTETLAAVHRKHSPPPPYDAVMGQTNSSTQTGDIQIV